MKKTYLILCLLGLLGLIIQGCSFENRKNVDQFVITDRSSGKVLNSYDYSKTSGRLLSTASYAEDGTARKITEYEYDAGGNLERTVVSSSLPTGIVKEITGYKIQKEYDNQNRLVKTIQTTDTGETIETFFGYDEAGKLRGVVERDGGGNLMMMDY